MTIPPACHHEIINGIELLLAARLRWAPVQPDDIERTGAAWLVAASAAPVAWDDRRDPPRIRQAFARLAGTATDIDPGDTLAYSKGSGPAWLAIAADATFAGFVFRSFAESSCQRGSCRGNLLAS